MPKNAAAHSGAKKPNFFARVWGGICSYFRPLGQALVHGDAFTRLSFLISGFGYFFHGHKQEIIGHEIVKDEEGHPKSITVKSYRYVNQWLRGIFYLAIEVLAVFAIIFWGAPNFAKLGLNDLATCYLDEDLMEICPAGGEDNAFLIVLFSVLTILIIVAFLALHISSIKGVYKSQCDIAENKPIKSARQDIHDLLDEHFYITTLALPIIGILVFTFVPTVMMVLIAFTNYGGKHSGGSTASIKNFRWVGFENWGNLFSLSSSGASFLTVFGNQLLWTVLWAFFATVTCFFGGLLLALLLNSKRTKFTKVWRTGFVITIAVPQFVTLMLIRYFLADNGIVNNILIYSWHLIDKPIGFLSDPLITKFTIIGVNCWVGFPYLMLMISGILLNIPADLYESARIDGAGKTKMFWSITMPYILQVCTPYLISSFVSNINNFNVIYLLTADASSSSQAYIDVNARESDLLITWLYNMIAGGAKHEYYMASIVGIIMFVISTAFTLITFTQSTKGDRERRLG